MRLTRPATSRRFADRDASPDHPDEDEADQDHQQDRNQALGGGRDRGESHDQEQEDGEDCDEAIHALHVTTGRKRADINAQRTGMNCHHLDVTRRKTERRRRALLDQAERVIRKRHPEFDLALADVAVEVGCSTRLLQLVFREAGGTTFRDHLLRVRMEHAHGLFSRKTGNWSVRKVARAVGYREASGLRPRFKTFYGYNPSEVASEEYDYDAAWREAERAD